METLYIQHEEQRYRIECNPEKGILHVQREEYHEQKPGKLQKFVWQSWQTILRGKYWNLRDLPKLLEMYELGERL